MKTIEDIQTMRTCASNGVPYRTYVEVKLSDLLTNESPLDLISLKATDSEFMRDMAYKVVDTKGVDTLILHVTGDVTEVIREINAYQLEGV